MINTRLFIIILCFLTLGTGLSAQFATADPIGRAMSGDVMFSIRPGASGGKNYVRNRIPKGAYVEFERYVHDEARPTTIYLLNGDSIKGNFLYNLEYERLESENGNNTVDWSEVQRFEFLETEEMERESYSNLQLVWPDTEYGGFIQNVSTSSLVKVKPYLEFIPKSWDPSTQLGDKNDRVVAKKARYLRVDNQWIEIPESKKAFFDMFGSYSDPLKRYARKNKLKFKRIEDVGKMINWIARNGM